MTRFFFDPFPELHTKRLLLRRILEQDAPALFRMRRDVDVMRYIEREQPQELSAAQKLVRDMDELITSGSGIAWAMVLPPSNELIGTIGYFRSKPEHFRAEVGYMLLPEFWKMGIMTEALEEVIRFGFDTMNLHSIEADINPENQASEALLKKMRFVKEAHFKENYFWQGQFLDSAIYSLLRPAEK